MRLIVVFLIHIINDGYMNFLPPLLPFLLPARHLTIVEGALLISAFNLISAVSQPLMGYLVDNRGQRWPIFVGTAWMGTLLGITGLIPSYALLLPLVALAAFGTAAFHPQATSLVARLSSVARRGLIMSLFIAMGNIGWSLSPLLETPWLKDHGLPGTVVFVIPALIAGALLLVWGPRRPAARPTTVPFRDLWQAVRRKTGPLSALISVVAVRSWTYFGFVALLPLYLEGRGLPAVAAGQSLSLMLFAGAFGGFVGGYLSDLHGRRVVIAASLILTVPCFYLFLHSTGLMSMVFLALAGATLLASFSVTVVSAQEILPRNAALAGGLVLGLSGGLGALGLAGIGYLAQVLGLPTALDYVTFLPLAAAALSFLLPGKPKAAAA